MRPETWARGHGQGPKRSVPESVDGDPGKRQGGGGGNGNQGQGCMGGRENGGGRASADGVPWEVAKKRFPRGEGPWEMAKKEVSQGRGPLGNDKKGGFPGARTPGKVAKKRFPRGEEPWESGKKVVSQGRGPLGSGENGICQGNSPGFSSRHLTWQAFPLLFVSSPFVAGHFPGLPPGSPGRTPETILVHMHDPG